MPRASWSSRFLGLNLPPGWESSARRSHTLPASRNSAPWRSLTMLNLYSAFASNLMLKMLRDNITHCKAIPKSRIKEVLQGIYDELGIKQRAKASDLTRWFDTKESFPKINGKSVAHITIIRDKFIVK